MTQRGGESRGARGRGGIPTDALALAAAVAAVSFAAPLVRMAASGPIAIAFWRVALASAGAWGISALRPRPAPAAPAERSSRGALLAGVLLGLHFGAWIASLSYTSVANSVLLVTTQPVWAALGGALLLGERVPVIGWAGIGVTLAASAFTMGHGGMALRGDLLALVGAVLAAAYMVVGRRERRSWDTVPYVARVYGMAALTLGAVAVLFRQPILPARPSDWWVLAALAAVPTGIGHSLYNWLLARLPAHVVATSITGEPIGASILAYLWLGEVPPSKTLLFAPLVLVGIVLVVMGRPRAPEPLPPS